MDPKQFVCDEINCESTVTISYPNELKNIPDALKMLGWACYPATGDVAERHFCPIHYRNPNARTDAT